jgi:GTP-binding protein HflX
VLHRYPNAVPVSARTRVGIDRLHATTSDALSRSFADLDIETSVANGRLLAYLAAHGEILDRRYDGDRVVLHVRLPQRHLGPLHEKDTTFRDHQPILRECQPELPIVIEDVA